MTLVCLRRLVVLYDNQKEESGTPGIRAPASDVNIVIKNMYFLPPKSAVTLGNALRLTSIVKDLGVMLSLMSSDAIKVRGVSRSRCLLGT